MVIPYIIVHILFVAKSHECKFRAGNFRNTSTAGIEAQGLDFIDMGDWKAYTDQRKAEISINDQLI